MLINLLHHAKFIASVTCVIGHADVDIKVQKFPYVKHGTVLSKHSHVINMEIFQVKPALCKTWD